MTDRPASASIQVGHEMGGNPAAYFMSRTKRCEELLAHPHIREHVVDLAEFIDHFCALEEIDPRQLEVDNPRYTLGGEYSEICFHR